MVERRVNIVFLSVQAITKEHHNFSIFSAQVFHAAVVH